MSDALADRLLAHLRERLGEPAAVYAQPPTRLGGGYYTENHVFRLDAVPPRWRRPLVLRLFPAEAPRDLVFRETTVQNALVAQGLPVAPVLTWDGDDAALGRSFLIMELLPGASLLGGVSVGKFLRSAVPLLTRLSRVLAETQAMVHRADPEPVVEALGDYSAGLDRWFEYLGDLVEQRAPELGGGLQWLVDHRPIVSAPSVICHGDLWPGNLLVDHGRVVGVLDWTLATIAEPALDVGFTAMALTIAPLEMPRFAVPTMLRITARMTRRFVSTYQDLTGADLANQPWYEALRCLLELTDVVDYRQALLAGRPRQTPRPTWDVCTDRMVDYFRARTGVTLPVPPPAG